MLSTPSTMKLYPARVLDIGASKGKITVAHYQWDKLPFLHVNIICFQIISFLLFWKDFRYFLI